MSTANPTANGTQVHMELSGLEEALARLRKELDTLEEKHLHQILKDPTPPSPATTETAVEGSLVPLALRIHLLVGNVKDMTANLESLLGRLEL